MNAASALERSPAVASATPRLNAASTRSAGPLDSRSTESNSALARLNPEAWRYVTPCDDVSERRGLCIHVISLVLQHASSRATNRMSEYCYCYVGKQAVFIGQKHVRWVMAARFSKHLEGDSVNRVAEDIVCQCRV